jgi:hypothetical protein
MAVATSASCGPAPLRRRDHGVGDGTRPAGADSPPTQLSTVCPATSRSRLQPHRTARHGAPRTPSPAIRQRVHRMPLAELHGTTATCGQPTPLPITLQLAKTKTRGEPSDRVEHRMRSGSRFRVVAVARFLVATSPSPRRRGDRLGCKVESRRQQSSEQLLGHLAPPVFTESGVASRSPTRIAVLLPEPTDRRPCARVRPSGSRVRLETWLDLPWSRRR